MSRRPLAPFIIASITGVLSGIYIFKPIIDNNRVRQSGDRMATEDKSAASALSKPSDGPGSTETTSNTN
ncbi:hypothetical protein PHLGIDRAFT_21451 [Phlebiopsis gigantea 11061_1 CR5-6]|uniref:Uncharacterized protein n=1 Tax=Phlebiopsis gigantea (strain 11061_1 CR5-6) TaxID=745531 RepID=A0A0C3PV81_PHLG1|nr:hypothetical protein PHLGIDRAFT_21451 [Phlebiopsis gigantea 11061_1 CR5-6]